MKAQTIEIKLSPKQYADLLGVKFLEKFYAEFGDNQEEYMKCDVILLENGTIVLAKNLVDTSDMARSILEYMVKKNRKNGK